MLHGVDLLIRYLGPSRGTALVLVAVNLLPLLMVVSGLWSLQQVLLLYWIENGVIGLWNLAKILHSGWPQFSLRLFLGAFFSLHYGIFFLIHGIFLMMFLQMPIKLSDGLLLSIWKALPGSLWPMVLALIGSHGYSAYHFHFRHGLWRSANSALLVTKPYGRVLLLHLALIAYGFVIHVQGENLMLLVILVLMKIVLDVVLHVRSHREAISMPPSIGRTGDPGA